MAEYTGAEGVRRFNEEAPWGRFPSMIGLEMLEVERDRVRGRLETTDQLIAGTGYLWAPVIVGLADALCAAGFEASMNNYQPTNGCTASLTSLYQQVPKNSTYLVPIKQAVLDQQAAITKRWNKAFHR